MARKQNFHDMDFEDFKGFIPVPRMFFGLIKKNERFTRFQAACYLMLYVTGKAGGTTRVKVLEHGKVRTKTFNLAANEKEAAVAEMARIWKWDRRSVNNLYDQLIDLGVIKKRVIGMTGAQKTIIRISHEHALGRSHEDVLGRSHDNNSDNQRVTTTTEQEQSHGVPLASSHETTHNTISIKSSSNKEENFDKKDNNDKEDKDNTPKTYLQVWEEKKKEFINYLKTDDGKNTWELIINQDARIKEKGYTQKEMLQEIHNLFVRWLNSNLDGERKRLHDDNYKKVGHLQNWLVSHYRKSAKQVKRQQERNKEDKTSHINNLYPIEENYTEARYTQLYSLLDDQRKKVITSIMQREGKNRAFRTLKEYCISANLIDAA